MVAFVVDEALALRLRVDELNALEGREPGMGYESEASIPTPGPVVPGPAAHLHETAA